jgi:SAM-dependent methyltransferase
MEREAYWNQVWRGKLPNEVSWFSQHLDRSLTLIKAVSRRNAAVIDIGGGVSTLVDDLLAAGYRDLSVLDVSAAALRSAQDRLGRAGQAIGWILADVVKAELPQERFDVWHDRAVFHFLTAAADRAAYARRARSAVRRGGHLVVATFAPDGPTMCSGLTTARYDGPTLVKELPGFQLLKEERETHLTPAAVEQPFVYSVLRRS